MISSINEFPDYVRVNTSFDLSTEIGGTFNGKYEVPTILYITVIDEINKPFGIFRDE